MRTASLAVSAVEACGARGWGQSQGCAKTAILSLCLPRHLPQGLYTGLGAGLGGLAGGLLYGKFGSAALFRTAAFTLAAGWLATVAALRAWGGKGSSSAQGAEAGAPAGAAGEYRQLGTRASSEEEAEDAALLRA